MSAAPAPAAPLGARRPAGRRRPRAGAALAEALVAALVLVLGVLATAGSVAASARDARRARAADAAGEVVAARLARWRAAPCVAGAGDEPAGLGGGRERWRVAVDGQLGTLTDTVTAGAEPRAPRVGVVAVAGCGP